MISRQSFCLTAAAIVVVAFAMPQPARAQARVLITPSASAGWVFDDNLFITPKQTKTQDAILRVTPGLSGSRESARNYWFGSYSFDAERYQDHPTMTTPLARQTALAFGRVGLSPVSTLVLSGGYDSTVTPSDFNVATGILAGYQRAWRWHGGPEIRHAISPVTFMRMSYDLTHEGLATQRITTHAADFRLAHAVSARDELRVEPFVREFIFNTNSVATLGGTVGWTRRFTPYTSLMLQGGPRIVEGSSTVQPELAFELRRRTTYSDLAVAYTRTAMTAVGLSTVAETQRVLAAAGYHHPAVVDLTVQADMYLNEFATTSARIYRLSTEILRALTPGVSISAFYSFQFQRGRLPVTRLVANPDIPIGVGGLVPVPMNVLETTAIEVPLQRNVIGIKLVISPTFHPTELPRKADPEKDKPTSGSIR